MKIKTKLYGEKQFQFKIDIVGTNYLVINKYINKLSEPFQEKARTAYMYG